MRLKEHSTALARRLRDKLVDWVRDPELLRRALRDSPPGQILLCMLVSIVISAIVLAMHRFVMWLHETLFALPPDTYLSEGLGGNLLRILIVPVIGGLILGLLYVWTHRSKRRDVIDPIEANAIYGGRMSARDSANVIASTLLSNASGASLGMEAAYTQVGSSVLSWVGQYLRFRREDLRMLVAAGSAAAIAAAFNAPLAGAFYGFELVLGSYLPSALPQISMAALTGALFMRASAHNAPTFSLTADTIHIQQWQYPLFVVLGILAALVGIGAMKAVTKCEALAKNKHIPDWARPALGGIVLSIMAIGFPQILGSGQGAINYHFHHDSVLPLLVALLLAKIAASAVSIGMGFRGGMFSSALLIGCLLGQIFGIVVSYFAPETEGLVTSFMLVGIGAVGASIIGAPVTMILLVLEMTGDFAVTTGVMAGVLVSSAITRYSFGYSFSTWRFHMRGIRIGSAHDIGWIHDITVGTLMRTGGKTIDADTSLAVMRELYPPDSTVRVFVTEGNGRYVGVIDISALHSQSLKPEDTTITARSLAKGTERFLLPWQDIQSALKTFKEAELEALPVVTSAADPVFQGYVTEAYALRRYTHELETRSFNLQGSGGPAEVKTTT